MTPAQAKRIVAPLRKVVKAAPKSQWHGVWACNGDWEVEAGKDHEVWWSFAQPREGPVVRVAVHPTRPAALNALEKALVKEA